MKTNKPFIETLYINELYPSVIGNIPDHGSINVYDQDFKLVKSIVSVYNRFVVNLDDVVANSDAFVFTCTVAGKTESDYSKIIAKRKYLTECE